MKRQFFFGTMLSATLAIGVGAQQTQGGQTAGDQGATRPGQAITVTGCLQPAGQMAGQAGAPTATPETGAPAGQQQARGFILTNVSPGGAAGAGTTGAGTGTAGAGTPRTGTGTAGTGTATGAGTATGTGAAAGTRASTYRLTGGDDQNLQQHVGHRVEVTGTMTPGTGTGTGAGAGTGTSAGTGTTPGTGTGAGTGTGTGSTTAQGGAQGAGTPTLRVTSVKPVAGTCP